MSIGPYDILANGTKVRLNKGGKRGEVISHRVASNGVVVHTILLTQKPKILAANRRGWTGIKEKWSGNYAFVELE